MKNCLTPPACPALALRGGSRHAFRVGRPRAGSHRGVSLIEVLVSILIISFGLLALAASQSSASRLQKNTELRAVAMLLAADLADRMRANPDALAAATYPYELTSTYVAMSAAPTVAACDPCSSSELAARDLSEWQRALFFALPGAGAYVKRDATNNAVDLWILWQDSGSTDTMTDASGNKVASDDTAATSAECPAAIGSSWSTTNPKPRCLYYRVGVGA